MKSKARYKVMDEICFLGKKIFRMYRTRDTTSLEQQKAKWNWHRHTMLQLYQFIYEFDAMIHNKFQRLRWQHGRSCGHLRDWSHLTPTLDHWLVALNCKSFCLLPSNIWIRQWRAVQTPFNPMNRRISSLSLQSAWGTLRFHLQNNIAHV